MMRKIVWVLILGLCLCGTSWAETTVERVENLNTQTILDPHGYRGAKWGMTEAEVKKAIPDVKWNSNWEYGRPTFKDKILTHDALTQFYFDEKGKLIKVEISLTPESSLFESLNIRGLKVIDTFNSLKQALTQKYGEPESVYRRQTEIGPSILNWIFPTTQISLKIHYVDNNIGWVDLIYCERKIKETTPNDIEKL